MNDTDARLTAGDLHRLAQDIENLAEQTETLAQEQVDTRTAGILRDQQEDAQVELRQLISNLIQLHAESGTMETPSGEHELAYNGSVPIPKDANTNLPTPSVGEPAETGTPPSWSKDAGTQDVSLDQ